MRINTWAGKLAVILVLACAGISPAAENDGALDTTRVRQPEKPEKSVGRVIADVPGEILKLPVRTVRFLALSVSRPPISDVAKVIKLSGPVQRYIPIVGYSSNAGLKLGFGLRQIKAKSFGDRLDFKWYYSTKDYQSYQFRFKMRELMGKRIGINFYYRYKKRPRESFYGVGMGTDEDCEANYTLESSNFVLDLPFHTGQQLSVGVTGGFLITNLYDGRDDDTPHKLDSLAADSAYALAPGRLDGARYIRIGAILEYDNRNHRGQPSSGVHVLSRALRYFGTSRYRGLGFYEVKIDFRHYFNVWKKRIIATRLYAQRFDGDPDNSRATPIDLVSRLGGAESLRGYTEGRFIDNDLALASIEWRYPVWRTLDGFVFLEEGRVFGEITDAHVFRGWKYSAGVGFRVWNAKEVSFSSSLAFSDEGTRFHVAGGITW